MRSSRLTLLLAALLILAALAIFLVWHARSSAVNPSATVPVAVDSTPAAAPSGSSKPGATHVYAHNLMLRQGPNFRFYVRWLKGDMVRSHPKVNPSFDDPDSFVFDVKTGVLRANIGDFANFLNARGLGGSPLTGITLSGDGDQIKLRGTLHKIVPLPVEVIGTISALPDSRIRVRVTKLNVLKIPFKGLLGSFHVDVAELFHPPANGGLEVSGNDIIFDPQILLPPPHIRGRLTKVRIVNPDIEEIYGDGQEAADRVEQWRNFIRLADGTPDFGKLTMRHVDLIMIDVSNDAWFDLDLAHYEDQLVYGYTRMTPQAGLQIFMPDLSQVPRGKASANIGTEWLKNRNIPPPAEVTPK
jgi:hypothetical protein